MKTLPCVFIGMILFTAAARSQDAAEKRKLLHGTWLRTAAELNEEADIPGEPRMVGKLRLKNQLAG